MIFCSVFSLRKPVGNSLTTAFYSQEGGGVGTPHMKVVGMHVVSLRGVNCRFWSHLKCSGQNVIIFSRGGLVLRLHAQKYTNVHFSCVLTWSLLGVKKSLDHAQIGLLQRFHSKFPTSIPTLFRCGLPPHGLLPYF